MTTVWIASDWHLAPGSPAVHARLARAFLARARAEGVEVVLNGDAFDDLFSGPGRAEAAHPLVLSELAALRGLGRLRRIRGNHDPRSGDDLVVLDVPGTGRVLVAHGHAVDPINASAIGRLGDAVSLRFGRLAVVKGAARLAERSVRAVAGGRMAALFRERCLALVERQRCDLGVFGHLHVAHLAPGDRYVNAGALDDEGLHFLELGPDGPRLRVLQAADLTPGAEISLTP